MEIGEAGLCVGATAVGRSMHAKLERALAAKRITTCSIRKARH